MRTAKSLISLHMRPGRSESSLGASHFVGFIMWRLLLVSPVSVYNILKSQKPVRNRSGNTSIKNDYLKNILTSRKK